MICKICKKKESEINKGWLGTFMMLMLFLVIPVSFALTKKVVFLGFNMEVGTVVVIFSLLIGFNIQMILNIIYCNCCDCAKKGGGQK